MPHQCPQKDLMPILVFAFHLLIARYTPDSELIDASYEPAVRAAAAGVLGRGRRSCAQYECLLRNSGVGPLAAVNPSCSLDIRRCTFDGDHTRARCGEAAFCSLPSPQC